jgi:hypothetical protein
MCGLDCRRQRTASGLQSCNPAAWILNSASRFIMPDAHCTQPVFSGRCRAHSAMITAKVLPPVTRPAPATCCMAVAVALTPCAFLGSCGNGFNWPTLALTPSSCVERFALTKLSTGSPSDPRIKYEDHQRQSGGIDQWPLGVNGAWPAGFISTDSVGTAPCGSTIKNGSCSFGGPQ